jgi:hypothetical protein
MAYKIQHPPGDDRKLDRRGQPLAITRTIGHHPDGTPITAGDRFCQIIATGEMIAVACAAAGMSTDTWKRIQRRGLQLEADLIAGRRTERNLTPEERAVRDFCAKVQIAEADAITLHAAIRANAIRGGQTITTITRTERVQPDGSVNVETRTETKTLPPDMATARWFAERRWPQYYGQLIRLEGPALDGEDLSTVDDDAMVELREAAERLAALRAGAIETTGT